MNLFGRDLDPQAIAGLVAMLATLVLWIGVLIGQRREVRWFRAWQAKRRAEAPPAPRAERDPNAPRGPWD